MSYYPTTSSVTMWLSAHLLKTVWIIILMLVLRGFGNIFITSTIRRIIKRGEGMSVEAERKKEDTVVRVVTQVYRITIAIMMVLLILSEFGADLLPVLTAAGIAGIALGLGGQYLIKDVLSGAFILFENQYRVGDVVRIGDVSGVVEDISLRVTVLRDLDGTVHHVPNGEIKTASNLTKNYSRVNLDIRVPYDVDLDEVERVINSVGESLSEDPAWKESILSSPKFLFVSDFGELAIMVKILGETKPLEQWNVAGEFRKRLKMAFDKEGIIMPHWTEPDKR